jgi:hypothetical protein
MDYQYSYLKQLFKTIYTREVKFPDERLKIRARISNFVGCEIDEYGERQQCDDSDDETVL